MTLTKTVRETNCEGCIFATGYNHQMDCTFNHRLGKFLDREEAELSDNGYYSINRVCNAYSKTETAEEVKQRIIPQVTYIVISSWGRFSFEEEIIANAQAITK